jgi:protein-disulfide isomerase
MSKDSREQRRADARAQREAAEQAAAQSDLRRRRLAILGGVLIAAVIIVVAVVVIAGGGSDDDHLATTTKAGERVPNQGAIAEQLGGIPQDGITLGRPDAPITIVEYGDLQCPVCAAFSRSVLPGVIHDYVRTGKARLQFRNLTFLGPDSERMARFAAAAGDQNRLWNVVELIYANQGEENTGYADDDFLRTIGSGVHGLEVDTAMDGRDADAVGAALAEADRMAQTAGVTGTPTIQIGRSGGGLTAIQPGDLPTKLRELTQPQ